MKKMVITSCCRNLVPPEIVYINNADSQPNVSEENCFVMEELIVHGHMLNLQVINRKYFKFYIFIIVACKVLFQIMNQFTSSQAVVFTRRNIEYFNPKLLPIKALIYETYFSLLGFISFLATHQTLFICLLCFSTQTSAATSLFVVIK